MSGKALSLASPAKINLFLEITGRRTDGYHELVTIMQEIGLSDQLEFRRQSEAGISFSCDSAELPRGEENLVVRAARIFLEEISPGAGVRIHLRKTIPVEAGLGGGSSNAVTTLLGLNRLFSAKKPLSLLQNMAAALGSDCAFFLSGGTAVCRGRGEQVRPRKTLPEYPVLVVVPRLHTSTGKVYQSLQTPFLKEPPGVDLVLEEFQSNDLERVRAALFNRLEDAAMNLQPELAVFRGKLAALGVPDPRLTGSGSAFFSLFASADRARQMKAEVDRQLGEQHRGAFATSFCGGQEDREA